LLIAGLLNRICNEDYAKESDKVTIDLLLLGEINQFYLIKLIAKIGSIIKRKIRYLLVSVSEYEFYKNLSGPRVLIF
jgi:hypothetical protein